MRAGYQRWRDLAPFALLPELAEQQRALVEQMTVLQRAVAEQIVQGLRETLHIETSIADDLDGVLVPLDDDVDPGWVAEAINLEGAWATVREPHLLLLVQPWFNAEEIDQTILSCVKVLHVLLGMHPPDMDIDAHLQAAESCHWEPPQRRDA